jgi:predicted Zn finger-like uncharacterized protein
MRLTCPNCSAVYEIPDDAIPEEGRDVECSNCEHVWFQAHPGMMTEAAPLTPSQRPIDPAVAEILQQEATLEFEARRKTQPKTGVVMPEETVSETPPEPASATEAEQSSEDEKMPPQQEVEDQGVAAESNIEEKAGPEEMEKQSGAIADQIETDQTETEEAPETPAEENAKAGDPVLEPQSGAGSMPDTLPVEGAPETSEDVEQSRGFQRSFMIVLLLAGCGAALYVFAPDIIVQVPKTEPFLMQYISGVDQVRVWLDALWHHLNGTTPLADPQ